MINYHSNKKNENLFLKMFSIKMASSSNSDNVIENLKKLTLNGCLCKKEGCKKQAGYNYKDHFMIIFSYNFLLFLCSYNLILMQMISTLHMGILILQFYIVLYLLQLQLLINLI